MSGGISGWIRRSVDVRENELVAVLWSSAYFFFILTAYYIIRPIRDQMGAAGGVDNLAWLFTGTLVGMLLLHPLYTFVVAKLPRRKFVPLAYRFFILNLIVFFILLRSASEGQAVWVGRVFFIWTSVFNLFVVSVFWSFMTDLYKPEQSKRLFGMVAVGGTLGAIFGSAITSMLVEPLGPINLLLVSALFLEVAARASGLLNRHEEKLTAAAAADQSSDGAPVEAASRQRTALGSQVIGGGVLEGIKDVLRSPYLLGIAGLMLFFTISSTFVYFQQADISNIYFGGDEEGQTQFFANIDLIVNILTLLTQIFVTGRMLRWLGVTVGLAFLPIVSIIGFGLLGIAPVLAVLVLHQVIRRAGNYAIQRPSREVVYTVLSRTEKYKAKNFNDTFVYRLGDQVGAWSYSLNLGLGISGLSWVMVPFCAIWFGLAVWIGGKYKAIQAERERKADARPPLEIAKV
jgi:ATP:ADP antiporter, AAA family